MRVYFIIAVLITSASLTLVQARAAKLIEFGWDEPDTAFMREHIREMEHTPFDGCVFHVTCVDADRKPVNFTWECWGRKTFTEEQLRHAVADLQALDSKTFTQNWLRFNVTPGDVDWFEDFSPVLANARLAAQIARQGNCPGLLFDIESYHVALWNYRGLAEKNPRPWEDYATQVRRCGAALMDAFEESYPNITIFLTFGYCLPWVQAGRNPQQLPDAHYGLLAPFLNGMLEAAGPRVTLIDGYELAYKYKQREEFEAARKMVTEELLPIVAEPVKYRRQMRLAFGFWMDADWRHRGWATGPFSGNFFLPTQLRTSLEAALELCDGYVWLYTETPRWWSATGPQKLPPAYVRAVRKAKEAFAQR
ncbi:MAG: hypothetical protein ACUVX8_14480 [Candidatus Zipacnadales bacterium]